MSDPDAHVPAADSTSGRSDGVRRAPPRLLVVGCGGIGGVVAAHLLEQGHDVTALTTNVGIADAIHLHGFRVRGETGPGTVRGNVVRSLGAKDRPFDYVLLATQPPQVEEAARNVLGHLAPDGAMVCFQNGLCEERVARIAGEGRVLGGIVAWGASMLEPGVYERTSPGGFVLGRHDGARDPRLDELGRILEAIGPTTVTDNLAGARWSKLAINCAISSLGTIAGDRLGVLMRHRFIRRLALEIMTEVVAVARATRVRLEKVSGTLDLDWIALTEAERQVAGSAGLVAKHALLLAVGARFRRMRSSMLSAIERGRTPAVEFLNGEVISRGSDLGIPTPINAAIRDEVLTVAAGRHRPGMEYARALFDRTRDLAAGAQVPVSAVVASASAPAGEGEDAESAASAESASDVVSTAGAEHAPHAPQAPRAPRAPHEEAVNAADGDEPRDGPGAAA
ncbi:ketopantoate reductase family protein [Chondromyces apiculatus]|nr:2-dehydropantoate 2-reductase [Chondromyces apiculatus]